MVFKKVSIPLILLGISASSTASAEGDPLVFMDVFGGYSWSQNQDPKLTTIFGGSVSEIEFDNVDLHNGPSFGGRIGAWLQSRPSVGIAIDATRFDGDIDNQAAMVTQTGAAFTGTFTAPTTDIRIAHVMTSIDLIIRHRGELFTPYVMAGPGVLFSSLDEGAPFGFQNEDNDISFAYKVGAGISYKISDNMHLFTEYRYIHGTPEYEQNTIDQRSLAVFPPAVNADVEIDVDAHIVVGGLSFRF